MRKLLLTTAAVAAAVILLFIVVSWSSFPLVFALIWSIEDSPIFRMISTEWPSLGKNASVSVKYGIFTDSRDGKKYKTIKMPDGKTWMAENLKYKTDSSCCYNNNVLYCYKYGRLYTWNAAMEACPAGWYLPSFEEWDSLGKAVGGKLLPCNDLGGKEYPYCDDWAGAGKTLKTKFGWDYEFIKGVENGTDDYGFSALPGGLFCGYFVNIYNVGAWWTATDRGSKDFDIAYNTYMNSDNGVLKRYIKGNNKSNRFSVRCVADRP
jgi:uncharacterized protein (TIGR02145 family)